MRKNVLKMLFLIQFILISGSMFAQIPSGYYKNVEEKNKGELKTAFHLSIKDHTVISYTGLWDAFKTTDKKPNGKVWDMYSDKPGGTPAYEYNFGTNQCGNYTAESSCYNREHSFPKSWFDDVAPMNSDLFHLYPTDGYVNGKRSNFPFGEVGTASWTSTNGSKLGNNTTAGYTATVFEPIDEYKGDFARTYFYMVTRYEDKISSWSSAHLDKSKYPGLNTWSVNLLLKWHRQDPVSEKEINRNNEVYKLQKNRNPYIDYPELAEYVWGDKMDEPFNTDGQVKPSAVETPTFTPVGGKYKETQNITILSATEGATIRYTLDGTEPLETSPLFTTAISVSETTIVKAKAWKDEMEASKTSEAKYTFPNVTTKDIFKDNFENIKKSGGNDGLWTGNIAGTKVTVTNGWTFENAYEGNECIKLGGASAKGVAKTPALTEINGSATLTFRAGAWTGDVTELLVDISGGGSLSATSVTLLNAEFSEYQIEITDATPETQIIFSGKQNSKARFFLDDVSIVSTLVVQQVEAPVFTPGEGTYSEAQSVTIESATEGATIRYTLDGTEPIETSDVYTSPINISETTTIQAKAWKEGMDVSEVGKSIYVIAPVVVETDILEELFDDMADVGGNDGLWSGDIAKAGITNHNGWAFVSGYKGFKCVKLGTSKLLGSATTPVLSDLAGDAVLTFRAGAWAGDATELLLEISGGGTLNENSVTISDGAFSEHSVNIIGGTATTQITFKGKVAVKGRFFLDDVKVVAGNITTTVAAPIFDPVGGTYKDAQTVTIQSKTDGAIIRYTIDGSIPNESSEIFSNPIIISETTTIKAKAWKEGMTESLVSEVAYVIADEVVPTDMLKEHFDEMKDKGGNDNLWSGTVAGAKLETYGDWTLVSAYKGNECIKLGATSTQGSATTPALTNLSGNAKLTFRAGAWDKDATELTLEITGGGALSQTSVTLANAAFTEYTINIIDGTPSTKVTFKGLQASRARFFLDDVVVVPIGEITTVATPTFSPNGGEYEAEQHVTIESITEDAVIRYTLDGTDPIETSALYESAITVSKTTTIKARAWKEGMTESNIGETTYIFPIEISTISELLTVSPNTKITYTGTSIVTFVGSTVQDKITTKFISDDTGAIQIYEASGSLLDGYAYGDYVTNITGKTSSYNDMLQLNLDAKPTVVSSGNEANPRVRTLESLSSDDHAHLVLVKDIKLGTIGDFAKGVNVSVIGAENIVVRPHFFDLDYIGTQIPEGTNDVTGIVLSFKNTLQIIPRSIQDIAPTGTGIIDGNKMARDIYYMNGNVCVDSDNVNTSESIEIFNMQGLLLAKQRMVSGLNTIPVKSSQILVVKIGNHFTKLLAK